MSILVRARMLFMSEVRVSPSHPRFQVSDSGSVIGPSGKTLNPMIDKQGYLRVSIYLGDRRWKRASVHGLVCEAFHGSRPSPDHVVAHGNGDPRDNRAANLRWVTAAENEQDKRDHGRSLRGERHHQARLTTKQVMDIRSRSARGEAQKTLAQEHGVSPFAVWAIVHRRTWGHI